MSFHKARFAPTEDPRTPRWYREAEPVDERPTGHPEWERFRAAMAAAGFGLHLTASAEQYREQSGAEFFRLYLLARGECPPCSATPTSSSATT